MYNICYIKNVSGQELIYENLKRFDIDEIYQIPDVDRIIWCENCSVLQAIADGLLCVGNSEGYFSTIYEQLDWLKDRAPSHVLVDETVPFSNPTHRVKRNCSSQIISISPNSSGELSLLMSEERYTNGGEMLYENAEWGDYIEAAIVDKDGVIPEAYRASLCESYPIVSQYVEKVWINPNSTVMRMDTHPLTAKISAGLYINIIYYAVNSGTTRKVAVNFFLAKKL